MNRLRLQSTLTWTDMSGTSSCFSSDLCHCRFLWGHLKRNTALWRRLSGERQTCTLLLFYLHAHCLQNFAKAGRTCWPQGTGLDSVLQPPLSGSVLFNRKWNSSFWVFFKMENGKWSTLWTSREKTNLLIGGKSERKQELLDHRLWSLSPCISGPGDQKGGGCCSSTWMPNREENAAGWKGNNHKYVDHTGMTNESWVFAHADLSFLSLSGWTGVMEAGVTFAGVVIKRWETQNLVTQPRSRRFTCYEDCPLYLDPWRFCIQLQMILHLQSVTRG